MSFVTPIKTRESLNRALKKGPKTRWSFRCSFHPGEDYLAGAVNVFGDTNFGNSNLSPPEKNCSDFGIPEERNIC
jgi:hypothetical protein